MGRGAFPWGTFTVNVVAALVLGWLLVLIPELWPRRRYLRTFVTVGFLGSFSTFSTWMIQVLELAAGEAYATASAYLVGTLLAGLAATGLGLVGGRATVARLGSLRPGER